MSITTLHDLLKAINAFEPEPVKQPDPQFYAHIDPVRMEIRAVAPSQVEANSDLISIPIEWELASKFMSGKENFAAWTVATKGEEDKKEHILIKIDQSKMFNVNRVDALQIVEVRTAGPADTPFPDIGIKIKQDEGAVYISYNGDKIQKQARPVKLYFTREKDPSYLKCAFSLDVNILNEIAGANNLEAWPNPIRLPIEGIDDLSVYTFKTNQKILITQI